MTAYLTFPLLIITVRFRRSPGDLGLLVLAYYLLISTYKIISTVYIIAMGKSPKVSWLDQTLLIIYVNALCIDNHMVQSVICD